MLLTAIVFIPVLALAQGAQSGDDLKDAYDNLKAADENKANDAVKKWAVEAYRQARLITKGAASATEGAPSQARAEVVMCRVGTGSSSSFRSSNRRGWRVRTTQPVSPPSSIGTRKPRASGNTCSRSIASTNSICLVSAS